MKVTNKALVVLKKSISTVANQAQEIEITTSAHMKQAVEILSILNKYMDSVKEKKEKITKPLNEALKNARAMFKPLEEIHDKAIDSLRSKMAVYQTAKVNATREEEAKIAARVGNGKGSYKIETAIKKMEKLPAIEKEVATDEGLVQFREQKNLKIVMASLIPREYLVPDEKKILTDLKDGKLVPGCIIEITQVPANYR